MPLQCGAPGPRLVGGPPGANRCDGRAPARGSSIVAERVHVPFPQGREAGIRTRGGRAAGQRSTGHGPDRSGATGWESRPVVTQLMIRAHRPCAQPVQQTPSHFPNGCPVTARGGLDQFPVAGETAAVRTR
ncbi:hypothetical protein GCM10027570_30410 [Streptomonospora sediminis]